MMRKVLVLSICCLTAVAALVSAAALADETKPIAAVETNAAALEVRADQHFAAGEWTLARPMYKKLADMVKNDPAKLGPVEERLRVCDKNIAKLAQASVTATPAVSVPAAPTSGEQRKVHPAPKDGQTVDIGIKELGNFDFDQEKGGNIPEDVKRLSGHPVRLRGFMIPMDQADNITKFALVPDLFSCCFGQPPQIQHMVVANCPQGKAVGYSPDEILVEGKLNVEEKKDDGYIISIFEVSVSSVKAAPR
jgi:hypothetical protein